jgi:uncharacterized membrane protein
VETKKGCGIMVDLDRIKLMTKMALYDKKHGAKDRKITDYYRADYIYRKNAVNRISGLVALGLIFSLVILDMFYVKEIDIFSLNYKAFAIKWGLIVIANFVLYTIIGTIKYGREYDQAQKRMKKYYSMLSRLDKHISDTEADLESLDGGSDERDLPN